MSETGLQDQELTRRARPLDAPSLDDIEARQQHEQEPQAPSPEEALAEAQRQIEERDRVVASEREARARAEKERDEARKVSTEATTDRVTHQEAAILSTIEAGKASKLSAQAKIKQARETGDWETESAALDELAAANYRINRAQEQKAVFDQWKQRQPKPEERQQQTRQETRQTGEPTAEAQRWLDEHPRYTSDAEYRADANASHQAAIESGCMEGSQAYINYIENRMTRLYGENHGQVGGQQRGMQRSSNGGGVNTRQQTNGRAASSTAAPPNRGGSERLPSGSFEYRDPGTGKTLRLISGSDGKETVSGTIPFEWVEGARISRMPAAEYAVEMLKIQQEVKETGRNAGLMHGESGTYK